MDITQVPIGYKLTDLGVLPMEWEVKTLGEIAAIDSDNLTARTPKEYVFDYVSLEDVNTGVLGGTTRYKFSEAPSRARRKLRKGDVLVATVRPNLKSHLYIQEEVKNLICSTGFAVVRCNAQVANPQYVYNHIFADIVNNQINTLIGGSNYPAISNRDVKQLSIPLPPLAEQQAIAAALGEMDALLAAQRARLAKQRAVKQGLLQGLLSGKQRLPGFAGEWKVKRLGDFGKCLRGVSYNPAADLESHDTKDTVRLLRSNNVQMSIIDLNGLQFVNERRVKPTQLLQQDDVVICMANGSKELVGKAAVFQLSDGHRYTFGAFMGCYRCSSKLSSPQFVFYLFQTGIYRQYIANLLAGSSISNLNPSSIEQMEMQVPKLDEQRAIAAVLSEADAYLAALEAEHAKTQLLKQGMMQNLLTGKLRLV